MPRNYVIKPDNFCYVCYEMTFATQKRSRNSDWQWNLLLPGVKITEYKARENNFLHFFEKKDDVAACIEVNGLMNFMNICYDPNNWRLFIDSSKNNSESSITTERQASSFHSPRTFRLRERNLCKCEITSRVNKIRGS
ncbi:hypothetical protein TNCT_104771 [Trichonephila clavata]|uniref:Uncharacterized protein n=1 Tax=Trichonephila clavata TaxID=2740835 RepID=A0A8X6HAS9_TRICU|nr:hypothetical protein TNCT_104771 [Trichonephila clavata]